MRICAVIPAAGRGTRLGAAGPKILTSLATGKTIWSILYDKLYPLVDHTCLILSPEGKMQFPALPDHVSIGIQANPIGMGDAIFCGFRTWSDYDAILVVWGDQVFVSTQTLSRAIVALRSLPENHVVLPVTHMQVPYVEYVIEGPRLLKVLQTREGDATTPNGISDVGVFLLTTKALRQFWEQYVEKTPRGEGTGEVNFLPFLPFLSSQGWTITPLEVADPTEARGINTKDDLVFFQRLYNETR